MLFQAAALESAQPAACQAESMPAISISFIVITENGANRCGAVLDVLRPQKTAIDEVVVITSMDGASHPSLVEHSWFQVVGIPDASVFTLRARVPAIARKEWVVVLEEHSLVTSATLAALRSLICERDDVDLVQFLGK